MAEHDDRHIVPVRKHAVYDAHKADRDNGDNKYLEPLIREEVLPLAFCLACDLLLFRVGFLLRESFVPSSARDVIDSGQLI